jgi:small conductance mechanosensitive channel
MEKELELAQEIYDLVVTFLVTYSFQLFGAVLIIFIGYLVAVWISNTLLRLQEKRNVDVTLRQFIATVVKILVMAIFVIIALEKLGVSINPFIAALGGLALGASFALQGPVSNYGAGLMIILSRLYRVGDTITILGNFGSVQEITLSNTVLVAEDGERIIIPNKHVVGEVHRNSGANRILEGNIGISYSNSPEDAIKIISDILSLTETKDSELKPQVGISDFGDSAINIGYRIWVPAVNYFNLLHDINLNIFNALNDAGITIPFPQRDVHLIQDSSDKS